MKSKEVPHIFTYNTYNKEFDSSIVLAEGHVINSMRLRCRFNTHRDMKIFGILATDLQVKKLNLKIANLLISDEEIFKEIEAKIINLGF